MAFKERCSSYFTPRFKKHISVFVALVKTFFYYYQESVMKTVYGHHWEMLVQTQLQRKKVFHLQ